MEKRIKHKRISFLKSLKCTDVLLVYANDLSKLLFELAM